jgi:hypothetical protein
MFKISRIFLGENKRYLLNILEYQIMGINLEIYKSRCDVEKFFLQQEITKLNDLKKQVNLDQLTNMEINKMIKDFDKT